MRDIESYLDQVCRSMGGSKALRLHIREELREHIIEAIERHKADGLDEDQAVQKALEEFGQPVAVREGLQAIYGRNLMGLVIERAMEWKEKTMKTGWKWNFMAHLVLAMLIALEVIFVLSLAVFILPQVFREYAISELPAPAYLISVENILLMFFESWFIWTALIGIAWAVFEWRCRSENKSTIRLAVGSLVSLGMVVLVCAASIAVLIPLVRLPWLIRSQPAESVVFRQVEEVDTAFDQLVKAVDAQDWPEASESARTLRHEFQYLTRFGSAAPVLAGMDRRADIDEIRRLVREIEDLSDDLADSIRDTTKIGEDPELVAPHHFLRLKKSYEQLKQKVPSWP